MDQVVVLLVQYLGFIPSIPGGKESFVTSSAINNYVRLKIMPAPVKRKYYRVHIAYLIMILTMKQSISISDVQKILPADSSEDCVRSVYEACSSTSRSKVPPPTSAPPPGTRRGPWGGWSSSADSSPGSPKFWRRS